MSNVADWIIHCADPLGSRRRPPWRRPRSELAEAYVDQAEAHGVLGAFVDNFFSHQDDATFAMARASAQRRHRASAMFSLMLSREADAIIAGLAGLPATIVKGPVFARSLYPKPPLRCFSDIDLLVAPAALDKVGQLLSDRGFELVECNPIDDPQEWKWLHRENRALMVELQINLVHAGSLRRIMTLPFDALGSAPHSPASLLLIALVHGGGHHYQRLQHVVDICQAARKLEGPSEEQRFELLVRRTNSQFVAVAGLKLAAKMFREPRCREIARALGPVRFQTIASPLLGSRLVMSTTDTTRRRHSWRRSAFRWLMKKTPQFSEL
jgi:hypothetical protein